MTENVGAKRSFISDFKALTPKQIIGIVVALAVSLVLEVTGLVWSLCVGFLIVAILLYMIPHILGVMSVRVKSVIGIVFIVLSLVLGTFVVADPASMSGSPDASGVGDNMRDIEVTYNDVDGKYYLDFDVNIDELKVDGKPLADPWVVGILYTDVTAISFGYIHSVTQPISDIYIDGSDLVKGADGWYPVHVTLDDMTDGNIELLSMAICDMSEASTPDDYAKSKVLVSYSFTYDSGISSGDYQKVCFTGAAYLTAMVGILFFLIVGLTGLMRYSAQKSRAKMEADGRLYPQGYGRCKACGAMVLPGEVECRKCGKYIDVPEEMRAKKKDFFTCSECGSEVPGDASVCPKCGAKFDEEETVIEHADGSVDVTTEDVPCPHCGQDIPAQATWCPKCGKKIKE